MSDKALKEQKAFERIKTQYKELKSQILILEESAEFDIPKKYIPVAWLVFKCECEPILDEKIGLLRLPLIRNFYRTSSQGKNKEYFNFLKPFESFPTTVDIHDNLRLPTLEEMRIINKILMNNKTVYNKKTKTFIKQ